MEGHDSFRLVVRRGPQPNQIYELIKDVTTLGRDITNDIVINDREVSRHHLRLVKSSGNLTIEDLGSTNGTFVNGKRVSGVTPLQNGDMVGLGETVTLGYEVQRSSSGAPAPSVSPAPQPSSPPPVTSTPPPQAAIPSNPSPYAPPQQQPQQQAPQSQGYPQQQQGGYQQAPKDPYAAPADPYAQQQQPGYGQQAAQQDYYGQQGASYGTPNPPQQYPGYDYDPYAMREEEGGSSARWLILGCIVFFFLACACFTVIALVLIDSANLWCQAPIISQIVSALGYCPV